MQGWVRSFLAERSFGFIDAEDGESYFFHLDDVRDRKLPVEGQAVTFQPSATPKGPRARSVVLGTQFRSAQLVYLEPDRFIMTREPEIRGHVIVRVVGQNVWYESNDPNEARDGLRYLAQQHGANAIVGLTLEKYSKRDGCSNYNYTMHRFYGHAVIAKRTFRTTDPQLIARSEAEMRAVRDGTTFHSIGIRSVHRPPAWRFVPTLAWSLVRTVAMVAVLLAVRLISAATRRAVAVARRVELRDGPVRRRNVDRVAT